MDLIENFISELPYSHTFSFIGWLIGLIGLVATLWNIIRDRKGQRPKWSIMSQTISKKLFKESSIEIHVGNEKIDHLTISRIALWNEGTTIKREDIATKDPITIKIDGDGKILDVVEIFKERKNDVESIISEDRKFISVNFEYLGLNDGAVLKVFHTGEGSSVLTMSGSMIGGKQFKRSILFGSNGLARIMRKSIPIRPIRSITKIYGWVLLFWGISFIIISLLSFGRSYTCTHTETILQVIMGLFIIISSSHFLLYPRMPQKLVNPFFEEP